MIRKFVIAILASIALIGALRFGIPKYVNYKEWRQVDEIGIENLQTEAETLVAHLPKDRSEIYLNRNELPPHFSKIEDSGPIIIRPDGIYVTTAGLGSHRSGFIIRPISKVGVPAFERWGY